MCGACWASWWKSSAAKPDPMQNLSRRQTLQASTAFAAAMAMGAFTRPVEAAAKIAPVPTNLLGVRSHIYTIVTPDLDASIHFYRDIMGYDLIGRGKLGAHLPNLPGIGNAGRAYAFIRTMDTGVEGGVLRLMEAPKGAKPARPRPETTIMDPGYAVIECMSRNVDDSYDWLLKNGVETISPPEYYFYDDLPALPGAEKELPFEIRSYSAYGPAGEQLFISGWVSTNHQPPPAWKRAGMHNGFLGSVLISRDRWPVWDYYDALFGLKPTRDTYTGSEGVNTLIGAKKGSSFQYGMLGEHVTIEWWEYRDKAPSAKPALPTDLDRTGHAMTTLAVNDLADVRTRIKAAKAPILAEGALPTPEAETQDGLFLRGPLGELIEVVGRT